MTLRVGSLFSGIGGLDLGLEACGLGPVLWQVEHDPFCRSILARHWPHAARAVHDVRLAGRNNLARVDLVCGGFPCQPHSLAGRRKATEDDRWLWPDFARIVGEPGPRFVFLENVPAFSLPGMEEPSRKFSGRWPRSGTLRNGTCSERPMWARRIGESGGSFWLTPTVEDAGREGSPEWAARWASGEKIPFTQQRLRTQALAAWPTPCARDSNGPTRGQNAQGSAQLGEAVNHWQTPCAAHRSGGNRSAYEGAPFRPALAAEVKIWSTPKASDADRGDCLSERGRNSPSLVSQAAEVTPEAARDWKSGSASPETLERNARPLSEVMRTQAVGNAIPPVLAEAAMAAVMEAA